MKFSQNRSSTFDNIDTRIHLRVDFLFFDGQLRSDMRNIFAFKDEGQQTDSPVNDDRRLMYLLGICFENVRKRRDDRFVFPVARGSIRKWTLLPAGPANRTLLQLMVLACGGPPFIQRLPFDLGTLPARSGLALRIECLLAPHPIRDGRIALPAKFGSGVQIEINGHVRTLAKKKRRLLPSGAPYRKPALGTGNSPFFILAYGGDPIAHDGTDDFEFNDPFFRTTRFYSLFNNTVRLTDPVAFLTRLNYRAAAVSRYPAKLTLRRLGALLESCLQISTDEWMTKDYNFASAWAKMRPLQQRLLMPILDAVRHVLDASPFVGNPLEIQGVMLMDRPEKMCSQNTFPGFIRLLHDLFPQMQFVMTLSKQARQRFPGKIRQTRLQLPKPAADKPSRRVPRAEPGTVALIQVDGRLPNLALMKLSRHFKDQGRSVLLVRKELLVPGVKTAYASCIFSNPGAVRKIDRLRKYYGPALIVGGSGVDLHQRLPKEIENLPADYTLYPELADRAMGFLTRGCPRACPFCIVPIKEGRIHQVSNLDTLLGPECRGKLILMDDNILAHPQADDFLVQMITRKLRVNFNQTLDIRLVDRERAKLLRRVDCANVHFSRRVIHFSLNDLNDADRVLRNYALFGFTPADNVEFICMYGFNTTLAEDVERFKFLRALPGAYVFVQEYQPVPGGPAPDLKHFFDDYADRRIDELIAICFSQNMKSMEKYYRWLSKRYVQTFGILHQNLVDTIFRYNHRDSKGRYIRSLAGTRRNGSSVTIGC